MFNRIRLTIASWLTRGIPDPRDSLIREHEQYRGQAQKLFDAYDWSLILAQQQYDALYRGMVASTGAFVLQRGGKVELDYEFVEMMQSGKFKVEWELDGDKDENGKLTKTKVVRYTVSPTQDLTPSAPATTPDEACECKGSCS